MFRLHKKELVAEYGDVNWREHGGALLIAPRTGGDPYLEIIEPPTDEEWNKKGATWTIYRISIDKADLEGISRDWFVNHLDEACGSLDIEKEKIVNDLTSGDIERRAKAYYILTQYFGPREFDYDPLVYTRKELSNRYFNLLK